MIEIPSIGTLSSDLDGSKGLDWKTSKMSQMVDKNSNSDLYISPKNILTKMNTLDVSDRIQNLKNLNNLNNDLPVNKNLASAIGSLEEDSLAEGSFDSINGYEIELKVTRGCSSTEWIKSRTRNQVTLTLTLTRTLTL
jgi:hypothetical protein